MKKTVCELFAGVGGFRLGLERAGDWKVVWANQWDPDRKSQDAFECYVKHFDGGIHVNEDIAKVDADDIPDHNLLVGGFPCQDYSVARSNAQGITGKKGVLWWDIYRILKAKRPPFVLLENVNRLLKSPSSQRGKDFGVILGCLRKLGYAVEWRMINAADYGFPQKRRRVFIFAFNQATNIFERLKELFVEGKYKSLLLKKGFFQDGFPVEEADLRISMPTPLYNDIVKISERFRYEFENAGFMIDGDIYTEKVKSSGKGPENLESILEKDVDERYYIDEEEIEDWRYMKGSKEEKRTSSDGYEYVFREGAIPFPDPIDRPARTILTSERNKNRSTHIIKDSETGRLRILTPIEVERLNGFDDNWTDTGMSHSFRYFCMGNALVVGLIEKMGKTLNEIFELEE